MIDLVPCKRIAYGRLRTELRYTLASLYRVETVLGRGVQLDAAGVLPMEDFRALVWAMSDQTLTLEQVGKAISVDILYRLTGDVSLLIRVSTDRSIAMSSAAASAGKSENRMDWLDLWSVARVDMRLSNEEFWSLTPGMFTALLQRLRRKYGMEEELTPEQRSKSVLEKVIAINAAMGGKDLREVK